MENFRSNRIELADVLNQYGNVYREQNRLSENQYKALKAIMECRTSALGSHTTICDECGYKSIQYNSCRNRHCPKCQYLKQLIWVDKLKNRLLPTRYFHIVFTIPDFLHRLFYINQKICYAMLFNASHYAIEKTTLNPMFLGAQSGNLSVLHTWGQSLTYHPHIHSLVPAGGIDLDGQQWIHSSRKFFVPVVALSKIYRAKLFKLLRKALDKKELIIPEKDFALYNTKGKLKEKVYEKLWHVHIKKTFKGAGQVLSYLGRYTHRVAINNSRLISLKNDVVHFRYKDYRDNRQKVMVLNVLHFIRRFLLHILPNRFYKIRYYGLFASRNSKVLLQECFSLLFTSPGISQFEGLCVRDVLRIITGHDITKCPKCNNGQMVPLLISAPADS